MEKIKNFITGNQFEYFLGEQNKYKEKHILGHMNYWICILNRENFDIVVQKKIWGVADRYKGTLSKVKVGDKLIFYITKESVFVGVAEVSSDFFIDEEYMFKRLSEKCQK